MWCTQCGVAPALYAVVGNDEHRLCSQACGEQVYGSDVQVTIDKGRRDQGASKSPAPSRPAKSPKPKPKPKPNPNLKPSQSPSAGVSTRPHFGRGPVRTPVVRPPSALPPSRWYRRRPRYWHGNSHWAPPLFVAPSMPYYAHWLDNRQYYDEYPVEYVHARSPLIALLQLADFLLLDVPLEAFAVPTLTGELYYALPVELVAELRRRHALPYAYTEFDNDSAAAVRVHDSAPVLDTFRAHPQLLRAPLDTYRDGGSGGEHYALPKYLVSVLATLPQQQPIGPLRTTTDKRKPDDDGQAAAKRSTVSLDPFEALPDELLLLMLTQVPLGDTVRIMGTSVRLRRLAQDPVRLRTLVDAMRGPSALRNLYTQAHMMCAHWTAVLDKGTQSDPAMQSMGQLYMHLVRLMLVRMCALMLDADTRTTLHTYAHPAKLQQLLSLLGANQWAPSSGDVGYDAYDELYNLAVVAQAVEVFARAQHVDLADPALARDAADAVDTHVRQQLIATYQATHPLVAPAYTEVQRASQVTRRIERAYEYCMLSALEGAAYYAEDALELLDELVHAHVVPGRAARCLLVAAVHNDNPVLAQQWAVRAPFDIDWTNPSAVDVARMLRDHCVDAMSTMMLSYVPLRVLYSCAQLEYERLTNVSGVHTVAASEQAGAFVLEASAVFPTKALREELVLVAAAEINSVFVQQMLVAGIVTLHDAVRVCVRTGVVPIAYLFTPLLGNAEYLALLMPSDSALRATDNNYQLVVLRELITAIMVYTPTENDEVDTFDTFNVMHRMLVQSTVGAPDTPLQALMRDELPMLHEGGGGGPFDFFIKYVCTRALQVGADRVLEAMAARAPSVAVRAVPVAAAMGRLSYGTPWIERALRQTDDMALVWAATRAVATAAGQQARAISEALRPATSLLVDLLDRMPSAHWVEQASALGALPTAKGLLGAAVYMRRSRCVERILTSPALRHVADDADDVNSALELSIRDVNIVCAGLILTHWPDNVTLHPSVVRLALRLRSSTPPGEHFGTAELLLTMFLESKALNLAAHASTLVDFFSSGSEAADPMHAMLEHVLAMHGIRAEQYRSGKALV